MLTDGHTSIKVAINYSTGTNAAVKWTLAGGAHRKLSCSEQQEKEGEEQESDT